MTENSLYKNQIEHLSAEEYWQKLVDSEWIAGIPDDEQFALRSRVEKAFSRDDPIGIFYTYCALTTVCFDAECIEGIGPGEFSYCGVLHLLAENSYGKFNPTNIIDELDVDKQTARVSFQHRGKRFYCEVPWHSDWFDIKVIDLVNKALEASGTDARFIELPTVDQNIYLVLISNVAFEKAVELGVIPGGRSFSHKD